MSVINSQPLIGASGQAGYNLTKSLRFRASAQSYLNRTFGTPTNNKIWTYSVWIKRGSLAANRTIMSSNVDGAEYWDMRFNTSDQILIQNRVGSSNLLLANTTAVYRDPSAWYHIVFVFDSNNATAANRNLLYVNGVNVTLSANSGSSDASAWNVNSVQHNIGVSRTLNPSGGIWAEYDGYEAEINFIDGQALTPSSFGETSTTTGVWIPKKYTGSYGTNGFYLPFTDTTSTSTLGTDFSGNSNTWTVNNISLTSGSTYDSMNDVPTLTSATTANYCVLNPIGGVPSPIAGFTTSTITNGNLTAAYGGGTVAGCVSTIPINVSGSWYWEATLTAVTSDLMITPSNYQTSSRLGLEISLYLGRIVSDGSTVQSGLATGSNGDVIGIAYDSSTRTATITKNNAAWATQTVSTTANAYFLYAGVEDYSSVLRHNASFNFGQQPFAYTPPTGFVALNTFNLPTPTIGATASTTANEYFDATLYTGNSTTNNIVNAGGMQPDLVWIKSRSNAQNNNLFDSIRGAGYVLFSNATNAETNNTANFTSFNSNGFSLASNGGDTNLSGYTYVGWQWRASNATAVTNTAGSITSTVSANTTAGFSVVTYTGTGGTGTTTVGHGLGVAPSMVIIKRRNGTTDWASYHTGLTSTSYYLVLNSTASQANYGSTFISPSSSTLTIAADSSLLNTSTGTYVAYCFAPIAGYSAFGSYTGNGSTDNAFIYTGFRPRFIMAKNITTAGGSWFIRDTARNTYNAATASLWANLSDAENASGAEIDILSNGFKLRSSGFSSDTYIYMAFAESPFKYANAR